MTDITYIRTHEGWLYLAVVLDLFSRQVIGWSMQSRIDRELAIYALLMAVWRRQPKQAVIVRSDQGIQFSSHDWQSFLKTHNLVASMSRRGNCYDNAMAECSTTQNAVTPYAPGEHRIAGRIQFRRRNCMRSKIAQILDEAPSDVIRRTRRGFPVAAIHDVAVVLGISEQKLCDALRIRKPRTARHQSADRRLTVEESDRLLRALKVSTRANDVLAVQGSGCQWLCQKVRSLGGVEPLSLLDTGAGYSLVMDTLGRIEIGIVA